MNDVLLDLRQAVRELRSYSDLTINAEDVGLDEAPLADVEENVEAFREMFGFGCPETLKPGLALPDLLSIDWQSGAIVSGEFELSNHFLTMNRTVDETLCDWVMKGIRLGDMRIVDAAVMHGGPIHVLVPASPSGLAEQLYVFNTREIFELELNYTDYLRQLSLSKGITYWQYLFCRGMRLSGFEKQILRQELAFVQSAFPGPDYQALQARWTEKSQ
jgi:hypothetical protein